VTDVTRRLAVVDQLLAGVDRRSLGPERKRATTLVEIGAALLVDSDSLALRETFARGLERVSRALSEHFPENIFWDLDFMAKSLLDEARRAGQGGPELLDECAERVVDLQLRFGQASPIRFSYAHDFLYGFDWARWVARDPPARGRIGPFQREFLERMQRRAVELVELIARDDQKYPRLADDEPRNPFGFSRRPDDERRLHELLARDGLVPIEAWRFDAVPDWRRPFTELREARAKELGLDSK
jgi:hypothetical protein